MVRTGRLTLFLFASAIGSLAATLPAFPHKSASEYPNAILKDGIRAAIVPVEDPAQQEKYFGSNLRNSGYIPALLILENETKSSVILVRDRMRVSRTAGSERPLGDPAERSKRDKALEASTAVPLLGFFSAMAQSRSSKLHQRLSNLEIQSTTISPGGSAHGFLFIPERSGYSKRQDVRVLVPLNRSGSSEEATWIECVF